MGSTTSIGFPTTPGAFDRELSGPRDVFVTKLTASGALAYSTFLGGTDQEFAFGIAVDAEGSAYVTGDTYSTTFPVTRGAYDTTPKSGDSFVTKLALSGAIAYSTALGGSEGAAARGIAVDAEGSAYVTGVTTSLDFPTTAGAADATHNGSSDVYVTKFNPSGALLAYSTFLGGANSDIPEDIAVDAQRNAYITGGTSSGNFPTTPGAHDVTPDGSFDGFVAKLTPSAATLGYSTRLGGSAHDAASGIAVDEQGAAYITGFTRSGDFPVTAGAYDVTFASGDDAFVTKLAPSGAGLSYSTFLGGQQNERSNAIALDAQGAAYVTGFTSTAFPTTPGAFDTTPNGNDDAFVTKFARSGAALAYSTYLGGGSFESGDDIVVDALGTIYIGGGTQSVNFPTTSEAHDPDHNGASDAFLTKLDLIAPDTTITGGPNGVTNATAHAFAFGAGESGATYECKLDTPAGPSSFAACASPQSYTLSANGAYTFTVRAIDAVGNADATPASRSFTIDTVAPVTTITGGPSGTTSETSPLFSFTANEAGVSFECALDGGFMPCTSPHAAGPAAAGAHRFSVRATDPAGNVGTPAAQAFTITVNTPSVTPPPPQPSPRPATPRVINPRLDYFANWTRRSTTFSSFVVSNVAAGTTLRLACKGKGCPKAYRKTFTRATRRVNLKDRFKRKALRVGTVLELWATAPEARGTVHRFTMRRNARPRLIQLCVRPGATRPQRSCG
jgi:hypothetical protein